MRSLIFKILILLTTAVPLTALAEYRAYLLVIEDSTTGQKRKVTTTLDNLQYPEYHPVRNTETTSIEDTWMCRQRSDLSQDPYQSICPNPRGKTP